MIRHSGKDPLRRLEDRSKWVSFCSDEIWVGMGPERELLERERRRRESNEASSEGR